jgi:hypothetical protein
MGADVKAAVTAFGRRIGVFFQTTARLGEVNDVARAVLQ